MDEKKVIELAGKAYNIIGAAMEVHQELGFGISEGIYEEALCIELNDLGFETHAQCDLPTFYKGILLEKHFRLDIVVDDDIIIELKAVETILPEHRAQLFNYMRLTKRPVGILLNFGKSMHAEKYLFNSETNEVGYFNYKGSNQRRDSMDDEEGFFDVIKKRNSLN